MPPETLARWLGESQGWVFEHLVMPVLGWAGAGVYLDDAFNGTEEVLTGALEVGLLLAILGPLERLFPYEAAHRRDPIAPDVIYTLLHRLGVIPLLMYFTLRPLFDGLQGWLRLNGVPTANLESLVPWLAEHPMGSFIAYVVIIDFAQYWIHRGQHGLGWWWALHAVHHSQRRMTFWADNRAHLLDSLITEALLATFALAIGVPPAQFAAIAIGTRMLESLSHANLRLPFGSIGERLLVSPRFHRQHHSVAASPSGHYRGSNYSVLLPIWDMLFGTADFHSRPGPTGIDDQLAGRDYGRGFWAQQWLGLMRMAGRA